MKFWKYLKTAPCLPEKLRNISRITGAAISRHLSVLKEADLVRDHRDGKFIFYDVNLSVLQEILVWIGNFKAARETSSGKQDKIIGTQPNH